jgi:adenosylmethionine-8-amino-7-oxononanoate aminotransferase
VLFIADCVICGFGRLGTWLGIDRWPVAPDLIALAKGLSGGTLPIGALVVAPHVAAPFFDPGPGAPVLRHGATYAGHPACCAAANAALDIYERDDLIERGRTLEQPLAEALTPLTAHPLVGAVRAGVGLLAGVDIAADALAADPGLVARLQRRCRAAGVLVRPLARGIAVSPPLIVGQAEIDLIGSAIAEGLEEVELLAA